MKYISLFIIAFALSYTTDAQLALGSDVPEIALPNSNDSIIRLSTFKGKVVLVDFWASWCGPCRMANPSLVRMYKKYKDRGFEIFSVSIDSKKSNWVKAIRQDQITYTHVIDNAGWNSKVTEQYFIDEIPSSFLLDKHGKIVVINGEGAALERKIKKYLAE